MVPKKMPALAACEQITILKKKTWRPMGGHKFATSKPWLPPRGLPSNHEQRGGTNTLIRTEEGRCFIFGGMHSDEGEEEPTFVGALTELIGLQAGARSGGAQRVVSRGDAVDAPVYVE